MKTYAAENIHYVSIHSTEIIGENKYRDSDPYQFNIANEDEVHHFFGTDLIYRSKSMNVLSSNGNPISDFYCVPSNDFSSFGFDVVGRLPEDGDNLEVALTKYDCLRLGLVNEANQNDESALNDVLKNHTYPLSIASPLGDGSVKQAKIVGIIDTHYEPKTDPKNYREEQIEYDRTLYEIHKGPFFAPALYRKIVAGGAEGRIGLYIPLSANPFDAVAAFNAIKKPTSDGEAYLFLQCGTRMEAPLCDIRSFQETYKQVGIIVTVFLTIVTVIAFVAMISSSVRALSPSVKILRSMGIPAYAVQAIYALEVESIALLCGLIAILPYALIIRSLKQFVWTYFALAISPFSFSGLVILISLASLLVLGLLLSLLVSWQESMQKPERYIH